MDTSLQYFVEDFAKALQNQTAAVFIGAGLSRAAGYPDWKTLVQDLARRLDLPISEDLITLATFAVNRDRGRSLINRRIVEEFSRRRTFTHAHKQLAALPFKTYWTTNYDHLIEEALDAAGRRPDVKTRQEDLPRLIPDTDVTVLKMHGDAESPQEAVLTRDDYEDYVHNRELFVDVLTADLLAKTFVFLGVSFTDPNLNFLLGRLRSIFSGARKEHFWVTRKPDANESDLKWFDLRVDDLQRYGIKTIVVKEYSELNALFDQLRSAYDRRRRERTVLVSGSIRDGEERAAFIQEFVEGLSTSLVRSGVTIVTGLGHGLGSYIATAALNEIYRDGRTTVRADQLIARPFPIGSSRDPAKREQHRRRMLTEAGFAVFIAGRGEQSPGITEEYRLRKEMGCLPIPIGATGNTAAVIWEEVMANATNVFGSRWQAIATEFRRLNDTTLSSSALSVLVIQIIDALRY